MQSLFIVKRVHRIGDVRTPRHVVVVGAGVGALAAAIDLAWAGCEVTVVERADEPGGKLASVDVGGSLIDAGPTVLTMRWVFEELFASVDRTLEAYFTTEPVDILARHAWPDGARLDLHADPERSAQAVRDTFGAREAGAFRAFCARTKVIYDTVEAPFLRSQRPGLAGVLRQAGSFGPTVLFRIDALRTMGKALEATFAEPRLRQLFGRYATYTGSSPFEAPATLSLIAHVERLGVHRVAGGMRALGGALANLARELGVRFQFGSHVNEIIVTGGRARGVRLEGEGRLAADAILFNGDTAALAGGLLGREAASAVKPSPPGLASLSAITWAIAGRAEGFRLDHHNVFFSADYPREFQALLREGRCADEPTVYACAQGSVHEGRAGQSDGGEERLLLVVNAPPTGADAAAWSDEEIHRWQQATFSTLNRCGLTLTPRATRVTTPADYHRRFPGTGGSLYGPRARGALSSLSRPGSRSKTEGLYLAGGSTHPGPGVPMAALSGRLAARQILTDLGSTPRSPRGDTSGTTSTR